MLFCRKYDSTSLFFSCNSIPLIEGIYDCGVSLYLLATVRNDGIELNSIYAPLLMLFGGILPELRLILYVKPYEYPTDAQSTWPWNKRGVI